MTHIGRGLFVGALVLSAIWTVFVGAVFWTLDTKFGGPHGWRFFFEFEFWFVAIVPSLHLVALAWAIRCRLTGPLRPARNAATFAAALVAAAVSLGILLFDGVGDIRAGSYLDLLFRGLDRQIANVIRMVWPI